MTGSWTTDDDEGTPSSAQDYAGDSADALTLGLVLLALGAFLVGTAWSQGDSPAVLTLGAVLGAVGVVLLVRGVHRLATNLDRLLQARLTGPPPGGRARPWSPEP